MCSAPAEVSRPKASAPVMSGAFVLSLAELEKCGLRRKRVNPLLV